MTQDAEQTNVQIETNVDLENSETGERESPQERKLKAEFNAKYVDIFVWAFEVPKQKAQKDGEDENKNQKNRSYIDSFCDKLVTSGWERRRLTYGREPDFSMLQYFNSSVRQILPIESNEANNVARLSQCQLFKYFKDDGEYVINKWKYHVKIVKTIDFKKQNGKEKHEQYIARGWRDCDENVEEGEKKIFRELDWQILGIDLQVYPSGVAILTIEVCCDKTTNGEDVLIFNDFARRISMPFISNTTGLCSDEIGIQFDGYKDLSLESKKRFVRSFIDEIRAYNAASDTEKVALGSELARPARFLKELIAHSIGEKKGPVEDFEDVVKKIKGFSDDRMFLIALYRDKELSDHLKKGDYRFDDESKEHFIKWLYAFFFVDEDPCDTSCANRQTIVDNLKDVVYPRWIDKGTIYASTNFSTVCLTDDADEVNYSVVKPFLYHYAYMTCLVYAQRLAILRFENQIQTLATELADTCCNKSTEEVKKATENTLNFYREYANFNASYMLTELSPQIQGIEFYQLLQKSLLIAPEKKELEQTLEALRDVAKARSDKIAQKARDDAEEARQNFQSHLETMAILLGVVAGLVPIFFQGIPKTIEEDWTKAPCYFILWFAIPLVIFFACLLYVKFKKDNKYIK